MNDDKRDQERVSLAQLIRTIREEMPMQIELRQVQAKLANAKYDALVREGFTEAQALELCKGIV